MSLSLTSDASYEKVTKGTLLFKEGKKVDKCYLIVTGHIALVKKTNDRDYIFFVCTDKDIVGEDCLVSESDIYNYSAIALDDIELIPLDASEMKAVIGAQSDWIGNILNNISNKINNSIDMITEHRIEDTELYNKWSLTDDDFALIKKSLKES